jgi:hypothetical protein
MFPKRLLKRPSQRRLENFILFGFSSLFLASPLDVALANYQCNSSDMIRAVSRLEQRNVVNVEADIAVLRECNSVAIELLIKSLSNSNLETVRAAIYALYRLEEVAVDAAVPLGILLADSTKPENVRVDAAIAIQRIEANNARVNETLLKVAANDKSHDVQIAAITALGTNSNGEIEDIEFLISTVSENDIDQIRIASAYALGDITAQDPDTIKPLIYARLIDVLKTPNLDDSLTAACVYALDKTNANNEETVSVLMQLLEKNSDFVRSEVAVALADISGSLYDQSNTLKDVNHNLSQVQAISLSLEPFIGSNDPNVEESISAINSRLRSLREKRQTLYLALTQRWLIGNRAVWVFHPLLWTWDRL